MPHFFISYAKKDTRQLALQLNDALNAIPNVTAWVDKSLRAGQSWELQIQAEIDRCDYMIVLYSPDINRHKRGEEESYMLREIHYAKRVAHKPIIPVMVQTTELPMSLVMEQYIDFTLPNLRLDDLIIAICSQTDAIVETGFASSTVVSSVEAPSQSASRTESAIITKVPPLPTSLDFMPAPFAWINIPMGKVTIERKRYNIPPFKIAKYPVTNAQFTKFIRAGGYKQRKWWTEEGWQARLRGWDYFHKQFGLIKAETGKAWTQPSYFSEKQWTNADHPVVGVSWYEAVAFSQWLSDVTGEIITLPTEAQWQYAAQGEDGRVYPWGNDWDGSLCNNDIDGVRLRKTTSVRHYEGKGDSPFGVVDMVGNVWEWCLTNYENKNNNMNESAKRRVLRGGSWSNFRDITDFRCDYRGWDIPHYRVNNWGFRLVINHMF